jgi:hypothetical protein
MGRAEAVQMTVNGVPQHLRDNQTWLVCQQMV